MPLMLGALALNLIRVNAALQNAASALASFAFILTVAVIGQYAPEPFASRYLMLALFLLCGVALFGALPWREAKALTLASLARFAIVTAIGLRMRPDRRRMRLIAPGGAPELRKTNTSLPELPNPEALPGFFNRRYLDRFVEQSQASTIPSCWQGVLMIDVDHFKLFNDHGGHAQGD